MATDVIVKELEAQVPGFQCCLGGEELRRASTTLSGVSTRGDSDDPDANEPLGSPFTGTLSWLSLDFEPDPSLKELLYSVRRYACLSRRKPSNVDAIYNYGLILQEIASRLKVDVEYGRRSEGMHRVIEVLQLACEKYKKSVDLRPGFHAALYNWGVALSELAGLVKTSDPPRSVYYLHEASQRYAESMEENPTNPQALNNWGLVLQEVSGFHRDVSTKVKLAVKAVDKFRRAIRLRPDFDHGCYNLGTIFYTHACAARSQLQKSQMNNQPLTPDDNALVTALCILVGGEKSGGEVIDTMLQAAGCYITLAFALQPGKEVYQQSLKVVHMMRMLPKPYLRIGYLKAPRHSTMGSPIKVWEKQLFALDHQFLVSSSSNATPKQQQSPMSSKDNGRSEKGPGESNAYCISVSEVICAVRCVELSLPEGEAFWIQTNSQPQGIYFVAEDSEAADCWVDALSLSQYVHSQDRSNVLKSALTADSSSKPSP